MQTAYGYQPVPHSPQHQSLPGDDNPLVWAQTSEKLKPLVPFVCFVVITGYLTLGRSFAYLGVRPLFIGELLLVVGLCMRSGAALKYLVNGATRLQSLPTMIVATLLWGIFDVLRPVFFGRDVLGSIRTSAFDYYPLYIAVGISLSRNVDIKMFIRFWKWFVVIYTVYAILLSLFSENANFEAPWAPETMIFNDPAIAPLAPIGTLALWPLLRDWKARYVLLPMSFVPIFFAAGRGTFIGMIFGIIAVAATSKYHFRLVSITCTILLSVLITVGPFIKGSYRGETFDPIINVARLIATFNQDFAYKLLVHKGYLGAADDMKTANGTAQWRKDMWRSAMDSLNTTSLIMMGQGHGSSMAEHTPDGVDINTPHNFAVYAIYYTGAVGFAIFGLMLAALLSSSIKIRDDPLRAFQVSNILSMVMIAAVGNMFETPVAAIPFFLLSGICLGLDRKSRGKRV